MLFSLMHNLKIVFYAYSFSTGYPQFFSYVKIVHAICFGLPYNGSNGLY